MKRALLATMLLVAGCSKSTTPAPDPAAASAAAEIASTEALAAQLQVAKASPRNQIDLLGFSDAVTYAKSFMTDTTDDSSPGALLLAIWGSTHMKWTDIALPKDETSYALTYKDPDEARGKRLCTNGKIIQIAVHKLDNGEKVFDGLLLSDGGHLYDFMAVGSSGQLVEASYTRFCGVVIGTNDYRNSGGGTGHAVSIVGMFDLPENKVKKPAVDAVPESMVRQPAPKPAMAQAVCPTGTRWDGSQCVGFAAPQPDPQPTAAASDAFLAMPVGATPDTDDKPFDMAAAKSSLAVAAAGAQSCRTVEGLAGMSRVVVVFDPSGDVDSATLQGSPFEGTSTGTCIIAQFHRAHVAPFSGSAMSVSKSFSIR